MALTYPKRNGYLYSFQSVSVLQGSEFFKGLQSVSFTPSVDGRDRPKGTGPKALGVTRGTLKVDVELTFESTSFFEWIKAHPQWLFEHFDLTVVYEEGATRDVIDLVQVTFDDSEVKAEGTEAIKVAIKGQAIDVLINKVSVSPGDSLGQAGIAGA